MATKPYTKTEQVQTTLTVEQREQLDAYAAALPASRADAIRRLIVEGLKAAATLSPTLDVPKVLTWDCCGAEAGKPHKVGCYTGFGGAV